MVIKSVLVVMFINVLISATFCGEQSELQDTPVLNVVMESAVPDIIKNWHVSNPEEHCMILSNESTPAAFPQSLIQEDLERRITLENPTSQNVEWESILYGNPEKHKDYVMSDNHTIPADVVDSLLARSEKSQILPPVAPQSSLRVIVGTASFINRTFRSNEESSTFSARYPCAIGLIQMSLPGYSRDGNISGLYYSRLTTGIGGGGIFVLLKRQAGQWQVQWTHTAWIE